MVSIEVTCGIGRDCSNSACAAHAKIVTGYLSSLIFEFSVSTSANESPVRKQIAANTFPYDCDLHVALTEAPGQHGLQRSSVNSQYQIFVSPLPIGEMPGTVISSAPPGASAW